MYAASWTVADIWLHHRTIANRGKTGEKSLDLGEDEGGGFPLVVGYCHTGYTRWVHEGQAGCRWLGGRITPLWVLPAASFLRVGLRAGLRAENGHWNWH